MSKKPKLTTEEQATMQSETDAAPVVTSGPLSPARRLRVMSRVTRALEELPLVDQRGVVAVLSLADSGKQAAMREILTILRGVDLADDRRLILQGVASVVGAPEP